MERCVLATQRPWQELATGFTEPLGRVFLELDRADPEAAAMKKAPALRGRLTALKTNSAEARFRQTREHSALQRNCRVIAKP